MGKYSYIVEQASEGGQDGVAVHEMDDYTILLLADGAGYSKAEERASQNYLESMASKLENGPIPSDPVKLEEMLRDIDLELHEHSDGSETTAIIAVIKNNAIWGASVGDSECWMFNEGFDYELTTSQYRKPLLGSGEAIPVGFGPFELNRFIVAGSDGLFKYTTIDKIKDTLGAMELNKITDRLINTVRLPSGSLQDDCSDHLQGVITLRLK